MKKTGKIEICANCSGIDGKEVKAGANGTVKVGCIGKCSRKYPELQGKVYGFLNGEFTVCDTKEAFLEKAAELGAFVAKSNENPLVDAFLEKTPKWRAEFEALRRIVLGCGLTEELKWGQPCYTLGGGNVLILGGFKEYIAIGFVKGALLKDRDGMLIQQTENVQSARQLRLTSAEEIAQKEERIKAYVHEAAEVERAGLELPVEKKTEINMPEELERLFQEDETFRAAFFALTPGRQRGYLYYFTQAKQSKTREARALKCKPKILEGKGLDE